ncbi:hypothetical protein ACH4ND_32940, partial [Streptomyces sp. NPDC017179]|uniref:hypothetical protein n=1 Tax=Streptomyces sp. NPDC017179 TaxID=3364979 RepID=UPI0037908BC2
AEVPRRPSSGSAWWAGTATRRRPGPCLHRVPAEIVHDRIVMFVHGSDFGRQSSSCRGLT